VNFDTGKDSLDLAGLAFVSGATAVVSGSTLVLTDGGHAYDFALGGSVAPSYVVTKDGTGTLITADPPPMGEAARLVQAMATFGEPDEAALTTIGSSFAPWHGSPIALPAVKVPHA
jgi:hypothetical protein